jgi:hypothetical protein
MSSPAKSSNSKKRRPSRQLDRLRAALEFDDADWKRFLDLMLAGFADFENHYDPSSSEFGERLTLENIPDEWFTEPHAFSFVAMKVFRRGRENLHGPVARHLFDLLGTLDDDEPIPDSIALAWLALERSGMGELVDGANVARLAFWHPTEFLAGVTPEEMLDVARLWLTSIEPLAAGDLATVLAAMHGKFTAGHHGYRLFDELMAADWLATDPKKTICRALLECRRQKEELDRHLRSIRPCLAFSDVLTVPSLYANLVYYPLTSRMQGLGRHAVRALVLHVGEPLEKVIDEFFLWQKKAWVGNPEKAMATQGVLDLVDLFAEQLGIDRVKKLVTTALRQTNSEVRLCAYRIGLARFGVKYARRAAKDPSPPVRRWAEKALSASTTKSFRSRAARKGVKTTRDQS